MQRHRAVGVGCGRVGEVDDDACLLAPVQPHDAADALLVDAAARGRREVHADRRARSVPALGQQLRVDEHVGLSALVGRERLCEHARGCSAGDRLGLDPGGPQRLRHVLGMVDAGRVDDARAVAEAIGVVAGGGHVQRLVVERRCQQALVEVAADHGDVAQRCAGADPQAAERRDDAAPHGIGEREVGDLGGEDIADVLLQQLVRRGHADVRRLREAADARAGSLAERRVGLVAEHDGVGVRVEVLVVLDEPRVRLDRDGRRLGDAPAAVDRGPQARAVSLLAQVALELVDEQPAMRQDQHAGRAAGIDEARRRLRSCPMPSDA